MTKLIPGDRVRFRLSPNGRRLDGIVADFLPIWHGREKTIAVIRPQDRRRPASERVTPLIVRWLPRKALRKLPRKSLPHAAEIS